MKNKIINELKKGCGKGIRFNSIEGVSYQVCCDKNELCPTCQALLTQVQEFEKLIDAKAKFLKALIKHTKKTEK